MGIENRGGNSSLTKREQARAVYMRPDERFLDNWVTSRDSYPFGIYRGRTVDQVVAELERSGQYESVRMIPATGKKPGRVIPYMTGVVVIPRSQDGGEPPSVSPTRPLRRRIILAA